MNKFDSLNDHRGSAWAVRELMRQAQAEIDREERKGADRRWPKAHPRVTIGWFHRRILRGEFKRRRA
jgi:hypothetical protein